MTTETAQGSTQLALDIPGLAKPDAGSSSLEGAVRHTLEELFKAGHVKGVDAGKIALAVELAQVITSKRRTGRASTIGNDARVLMEILDSFVQEAEDADEDLAEAMRQWAEVMEGGASNAPDAPA